MLLIDEIDRADHEFEALLLEFLSDFQISIPERGTLKAKAPPVVVLTSNRTRDLHEALRRRCVYHWIGYPDRETEARIVMLRAPHVAQAAAHAAVNAVQALRNLALIKRPGISEAVEWAAAADLLKGRAPSLDDALRRSIGVALKEEDDLALVRENLARTSRRGGAVRPEPFPEAARAFLEFPANSARPTGSPIAGDQALAFMASASLLAPLNLRRLHRAAHATLAPPPERHAEFDASVSAVLFGRRRHRRREEPAGARCAGERRAWARLKRCRKCAKLNESGKAPRKAKRSGCAACVRLEGKPAA